MLCRVLFDFSDAVNALEGGFTMHFEAPTGPLWSSSTGGSDDSNGRPPRGKSGRVVQKLDPPSVHVVDATGDLEVTAGLELG